MPRSGSKVLEHHTDLGRATGSRSRTSSFAGAGNLLGAEQSGHAQAVGFDLYMRWLEETVKALRGQGTAEQPAPPDVVLDRPATPGRLRPGRRREARPVPPTGASGKSSWG
jgi:transcription-repair coupling factor (superfamily II helicase)